MASYADDVLHRHVKHHAQGPSKDAEAEAEVFDSGTDQDLIEPQASSGALGNLDNDTIIVVPTAPPWQQFQDETPSLQLIGQVTEPVAAAQQNHPSWDASFSSVLEHQMNRYERSGHVHVEQETNP